MVLIAILVAAFLLAIGLVRGLDRLINRSGSASRANRAARRDVSFTQVSREAGSAPHRGRSHFE